MAGAVKHLASGLPPVPARPHLEQVLGRWPARERWAPQLKAERLQRLVIPAEANLGIPAFLLRPEGQAKGLLAAVDDRGKEAALSDAGVLEAWKAGWAVLGIDPRAIGESKTSRNTWLFAISLLEGENLVWLQAWDIQRVMEGVAAADFQGIPLALSAHGPDASLAATYLLGHSAEANRPKLSWFVLRDGFLTYHDFLDRPKSMPISYELLTSEQANVKTLDREIPGSYLPFDSLDFFDIPQLLAAPGIPGMLVNPIDGDWLPKAPAQARRLLSGKLLLASGDAAEEAVRRFVRAAAAGNLR